MEKPAEEKILATIEDVPDETIHKSLIKANITDQILAKIKAETDEMLKAPVDTREAMEKVKRLRLDIGKIRIAATKLAEDGRADAVKVQRLWIAAEKRVTGAVAEQEQRLKDAEQAYLDKLKAEEEAKAKVEAERVEGLIARLKEFEWDGNPLVVAQASPEQFEVLLAETKAKHQVIVAGRKAEAERIAKEEADRKAQEEANRLEAQRLAEERQKFEQEKAALEAQKRAQEEEARRIAEEKAAAERRALEEKLAAERAEREKAEAEAQRLAAEKAAKEKAEAEEAARKAEEARQAAMAPDKEKLAAWLAKIQDSLTVPAFATAEFQQRGKEIRSVFMARLVEIKP